MRQEMKLAGWLQIDRQFLGFPIPYTGRRPVIGENGYLETRSLPGKLLDWWNFHPDDRKKIITGIEYEITGDCSFKYKVHRGDRAMGNWHEVNGAIDVETDSLSVRGGFSVAEPI